jgi:thymidylate kinase
MITSSVNATPVTGVAQCLWNLPTVVGVEGLPYAGKSTVILELAKNGIPRLGELAEFFKNGESFPSFSETTEDSRESFAWFVAAEAFRCAQLHEYSSDSFVLSDRTIVSSLAYSHARRATYSIGDIHEERQLVTEAVNEHKIIIPPLIYVRIPIETYLYRRASTFDKRCDQLGRSAVENVTIFERAQEFFEAELEYYDTIALRLREQIHVIDGTQPLKVVTSLAKQLCHQISHNYSTIPLEALYI